MDSADGNWAAMAAVLPADPALIGPINPDFDAATLPTVMSATSVYGVLSHDSCLNTGIPGGHTMLESYGGHAVLEPAVDAAHAITPMDLPFENHPPCFLGCGDKDFILPSMHIYEERLKNAGHAVTKKIYTGAAHGYFNFPEGATKKQSQLDIVAFLNEVEERTA